MSPEDRVEVVEAWHEALNAGDADRLVRLSHPDVAMEGPRGSVRGSEVLRAWVARANIRLEPLLWYARGQTVVVKEAATWRDAQTGEPTGEATVATVFGVDDGLVAGVARYDDLAAALSAAGLDESHEIPSG